MSQFYCLGLNQMNLTFKKFTESVHQKFYKPWFVVNSLSLAFIDFTKSAATIIGV